MKRIKTKVPFLRLGEISLTDLVICLVKNAWVVLLIALASAITAYSAVSASIPDSYSSSMTLAVRNTQMTARWNDSLYTAKNYAQSLAKAINDRTVSTDFASDELNKKLNVTVQAIPIDTTNLITLTASAPTPEEAYLYLLSLSEHIESFTGPSTLTNLSVEVASEPAMAEYVQNNPSLIPMLLVAAGGALLACVAIVLIYYFRVPLATRRSARRLTVLSVAGALNKGAKGRGLDACLPLPTSEDANGSYTQQLADAASFLLDRDCPGEGKKKYIQAVALSPQASFSKKDKSLQLARRIALNLALAMTDMGARICLVDPTGEALADLMIEKSAAKQTYIFKERLIISTSALETVQAQDFDKVIFALPQAIEREEYHILWCLPAGRFTAEEVNELTAPVEGKCVSADLLLYGLASVRDARDVQNAQDEKESDEDEIDLLRWAVASLRAMARIKMKWVALLALASVAAIAIGWGMRYSNIQTNTVFSAVTADVAATLSSQQLENMTADEAVESMSEWTDLKTKGNALYPTARATDVDLLMTEMNALWNSQVMEDAVKRHLGLSEDVDFTLTVQGDRFMLSVVGSDREKTEAITSAFLEVAPSIASYTAGGLTLFADEPVTEPAGKSMVFMLAIAWIAVIFTGIVYALIVGYLDRSLYRDYEVSETLNTRLVGKCSISRRQKKKAIEALGSKAVDVELAQFFYDWAVQKQKKQSEILMVTSTLRREGSDQLTQTVEALLKQNGLTVMRADRSICDKLLADEKIEALQGAYDVLLIDCPGMALDSDTAKLAGKADFILWALRIGYADRERIASAVRRLDQPEKLIGCVKTVAE